MIFAGFFSELARQGANWRECGPEKRCFWGRDLEPVTKLEEQDRVRHEESTSSAGGGPPAAGRVHGDRSLALSSGWSVAGYSCLIAQRYPMLLDHA